MSDPTRDTSPSEPPPPDLEEAADAARTVETPADVSQKTTALEKRKKKKRAANEGEAAATPSAPAPLPGAGTPEGDALRDANAAFEAGNYALVRTLTRALERSSDPQIVDAARDLARRTSVDPLQLAFLGACFVALLIIVHAYILR